MFDILSNPTNRIYESLLDLARKYCSSFSLTWNIKDSENKTYLEARIKLEPYKLRETITNEWPGTRLLNKEAIVSFYKLTDNSANVLKMVSSLYSWINPEYPEDLAFYDKEGNCWLLSIAHEKDSSIISNKLSKEEISIAIPGLSFSERLENN